MSKREEKFARTYFWASYYGQLDYVKKFLKVFGFSPFMKTYNHQNLVHAAIKGGQYEMLEFLVKDTS